MKINRLQGNIFSSILQNILLNKKIVIGILLISSLILPALCKAQNLLRAPQKIVIDSKRNRLLVSNYDTGDIIKIDSAGNQSYFKKGANFVDGLEIVGDTIYGVGNNRTITAYNLATKQQVMSITLSDQNGEYLSSIASDSSGHLFISCPYSNTIYKMRISDGSYWIFAKDNGLNKPNGILLEKEKNRILVIDDSPKQSIIHAISLRDSTVSTLMTTKFDSPDGIVRDKYGAYYIGGYFLPGIYKIDSAFSQPPELFYPGNTFVYPTYDAQSNSLLVTIYGENSWRRISTLTYIGKFEETKKNYFLLQNYPNPFNPSTVISYQLSTNSFTTLKVYDSIGREVAMLVNEVKEAGTYTAKFNATKLSGGMYLAQLQSGDHVQMMKMQLLK